MPNVIDGNASGDQYLYGTGDPDVFTFTEGHGYQESIVGFNARQGDIIDLSGFQATITWEDLQDCMTAVQQDPIAGQPAVVIDLTQWGGGYITVYGHNNSGYSLGDLGFTRMTEDMFKLPEGVFGTDGNDKLYGGDGDDELHGGGGVDDLQGYAGNDILYGGTGNDVIGGGAGDDRIIGGAGDDQLHGGTGDDVFVYASGDGDDTIWDFRPSRGDNKIDLTGVTGVSQYSDLIVTSRAAQVVIEFSGQEGSITLQNFNIADLDESSFIFADAGDVDAM